MLKHTNMTVLPQVQAALRNRSETGLADVDGHDLEGRRVLTSFGLIPYLNWFVFVEQSLSEAYAPLVSQAVQSALLVLVGMVLTVLATVALVRKMVSPIQAPVSYTHLDVYKRQVPHCARLPTAVQSRWAFMSPRRLLLTWMPMVSPPATLMMWR